MADSRTVEWRNWDSPAVTGEAADWSSRIAMAARAEREWDDLGWKRWLRDWWSSWEELERFAAADPSMAAPSMAERPEAAETAAAEILAAETAAAKIVAAKIVAAEIAVPRTLRRGTRLGILGRRGWPADRGRRS